MTTPPIAKLFPRIAFPVDIHVLLYGDHPDLAGRVLGSLSRNTDPDLFTLTVGLNAVVPATAEIVASFQRQKPDTVLVASDENLYKCPMMRKMFAAAPGRPWSIWFDDDSHLTHPDWLQSLAITIETSPGGVMFGKVYSIDIGQKEASQLATAPWFRGIPFRESLQWQDHYRIEFPVGGAWAIETRILQALDWPDPALIQTRDDYVLGEAMRQNGFQFASFEHGFAISDAPSRATERRLIEEGKFRISQAPTLGLTDKPKTVYKPSRFDPSASP